MSVCYNKLWKLLIDKNMTKKELSNLTGIASSTITKMSNNQYVSLEVLERLCKHLDCKLTEVVDINCEKEGEING